MRSDEIVNKVRVYYDAENFEGTPKDKRYLPIVLEYAGKTYTWLPKGPLFILEKVTKKIPGSDGTQMIITNHEWMFSPKKQNPGPFYVDVDESAWRAWLSVGKWKKILFAHDHKIDAVRQVLITEVDMYKRSHKDLEDADRVIADKLATIARLEAEEKTLRDRAAGSTPSPS